MEISERGLVGELLAWRTSPERRKHREADAVSRLKRRRELVGAIEAAERAAESGLAPLAEKRESTAAAYEAAVQALEAARVASAEAEHELAVATFEQEHQVKALQGELGRLAPAAIDELLEDLRSVHKRLIVNSHKFTSARFTEITRAIRTAREGAEALRHAALSDAEIEARLQKLRGLVPAAVYRLGFEVA